MGNSQTLGGLTGWVRLDCTEAQLLSGQWLSDLKMVHDKSFLHVCIRRIIDCFELREGKATDANVFPESS